jgi:perosamine synthetase
MRRAVSLYYAALWRDEAACLLAASRDLLLGRRHPAEIRWSEEVAARIARMTGAAGAFTFPSARSALLATLRAMGVGPGHEVIVTGYTCAAVPAPVLYCGAAPVYVDIEPQTFNVEPLHVERAVSKRTRVVVVQHTYGNPAPVDAIVSMARSRGLQVIEDCCLALGSLDRGRPLGTRGDAAIVSFELSKTLSAGWGGAVWFNAPGLRDRLAAQHAACEFPSRVRAARLAWQVGCSYGLYHPSAYRAGRYVAAALYRSRLFRVSTTAGEARGLWRRDFLTQPSDIHWQVLARQLERLDGIVDWGRRAAAT